jgi:hypothetical protein
MEDLRIVVGSYLQLVVLVIWYKRNRIERALKSHVVQINGFVAALVFKVL